MFFFFSSRRRHTRLTCDWSSDVCSSDLTTGPIPAAAQRIEFSGSQLVWQYYPGQGLELQVLGTFGKADGMYTAGRSQYAALRGLLAERSEERRVGKECRRRGPRCDQRSM